MKISSINYAANGVTKAKQQNFTGSGVDFLVKFWQFVDNGGRAMQFTVEDMTGTNIPRTIKGATAGIKYTGKINFPALFQEAIREFLTGPTMCVTPVAILALATKLSGKTANTHLENIKNLSHLMTKVQEGAKNSTELDEEFFKTVSEDLLKTTLGNDSDKLKEADVENISSLLGEYKNALRSKDKKTAKKILQDAQSTYENIIKEYKTDYKKLDFLNTSYTIKEGKTGVTKFKNYFEYAASYVSDFANKYANKEGLIELNSANIANFKNNWIGKRAFVIAAMLGITGFLMSFIPKIYTKASGGVNPNASAIYKEAGKNSTTKKNEPESKEVK